MRCLLRHIGLWTALGLLSLLVGCAVPPPAGPTDSYGVDFTPPTDSDRSILGAFVFVIDGVNADVFDRMLEAGKLPNIRRYVVARGLYCPQAVANVPSVTLMNLTSIATGRFPGHNNLTGNNWFDRDRGIWRDYATLAQKNTLCGDHDSPLIFECIDESAMTVSVFFQPHRGATKFFENGLSAGPPFFFGWYDFVDRLTLYRFGEMMSLARMRGQFPRLVIAYMLWPDFAAYEHGLSSDTYSRALIHSDRQIGRLCKDLDRAGLIDRVVVAIVSDHSHSDVKTHWSMEEFLARKHGLSTADRRLWEQTHPDRRRRYYDEFDAVIAVGGDRFAGLYLRATNHVDRADAWSARPDPARVGRLAESLLAEPAVDVVAWKTSDGRVIAANVRGQIAIEAHDGPEQAVTVRTLRGTDPFGWGAADGRRSGRAWLEATHDSPWPDLPAQLAAYFSADRAGDLAVFAAPGWDFGNQHRGGHGGVRAHEDMFVPMVLAGPGVPHARQPISRTVDLMPTLLQLLNQPIPENLDGRSLLADPEAGSDTGTAAAAKCDPS